VNLEVLVRRKTRDLVGGAAEDVLRAQYPEVARVDRAESWAFQVDPADSAKVHGVLENGTLIVNPNVHRWVFAQDAIEEPLSVRRSRVRVRVRGRVDARAAAVLRSMRDRRGIDSLAHVWRAVLWTIDLDAPREEAWEIARRITGLSGRGAGVLANAHAQDVEMEVEGA
jgi:phosphoribosylformylglycinamidine (FGAM) synthase PurS component